MPSALIKIDCRGQNFFIIYKCQPLISKEIMQNFMGC